MDAREKAYKEKLRNFFSTDEIEINSVDELREKLKRRQLLFPNAKVNDFIKANLQIDNTLNYKNINTSLSKEEQKEILKSCPKNINEAWEKTTLVRSCKNPSIKKAALSCKDDKYDKDESKNKNVKSVKLADKNCHAIKNMLTLLKYRKRGHDPVDFENSIVFNEIRNKKTELTELESLLVDEYRKHIGRIKNRKTSKKYYIKVKEKRLSLSDEELEKIRKKTRDQVRKYNKKNKNKINFISRFRFYMLSEEEKEKLRAYRREKAKEWRERNPGKSTERYNEWREKNREAIREAERKRYKAMPEDKKQKILARKKKWREENPEKVKAYRDSYLKENRDKIVERMRKFKESNPESVRATMKRYYEKHKEALRAKRIARKQKAIDA